MLFFLFWIGLKGLLGFVVGMGIMAYLILTENVILFLLVDFIKNYNVFKRGWDDGRNK